MLQRDIDATLHPVTKAAKAYFDDINIGSKKSTVEMSQDDLLRLHDQDLRRVLD